MPWFAENERNYKNGYGEVTSKFIFWKWLVLVWYKNVSVTAPSGLLETTWLWIYELTSQSLKLELHQHYSLLHNKIKFRAVACVTHLPANTVRNPNYRDWPFNHLLLLVAPVYLLTNTKLKWPYTYWIFWDFKIPEKNSNPDRSKFEFFSWNLKL